MQQVEHAKEAGCLNLNLSPSVSSIGKTGSNFDKGYQKLVRSKNYKFGVINSNF